jgi:hypothetical protein
VANLFIKSKNAYGAAVQIVAAFAKHGIAIEIEQIRVPVFYDGPNKGMPRNFAYVHSLDRERVGAALKLARMNHDGASFFICEARQRIPARFSGQQIPPAVQPRAATVSAIQPKNERFKPFTEEDFRNV